MYTLNDVRKFAWQLGFEKDCYRAYCEGYEKLDNLGLYTTLNWAAKGICDGRFDGMEAVEKVLSPVYELSGLHKYTVDGLAITLAFMYLRDKYKENGLPDDLFWDTAKDIVWKSNECHKVEKVWGSSVGLWYHIFFRLTGFCFGRFQYETIPFPIERLRFENVYCEGPRGSAVFHDYDFCVTIHIPSSGVPITDEVRMDSYKKAHAFYASQFSGGVVPFTCASWLLFPQNREILPEKSNVLRFMDDFVIVKHEVDNRFYDGWRIFGCGLGTPLEEYPRETSMQKAYYEWLKAGKKCGSGCGIFLFDGEKIYNKPSEIVVKKK
ncbi:MAG: acyltransferase domain-containing protein [Firmicutes bacterium]|nr:acyltransferase domain-containing protein [Bacillota bacterium]